jgi:hypothetical protein
MLTKFYSIVITYLTTLAFVFVSVVFYPSSANATECPSDWGYKLPELKFETKSKDVGNLQQVFYTSTLGSSKSGGLIGKKPQLFSPDIQAKIDSLGTNIAMKASYKTSTKSFVQSKFNGGYGDWEEFGYADMPSWILLWLGISNGTKIQFDMVLSQKGCLDFKTSSNTFTFGDIPALEYGFDRYFESFSKGGTSKVLNFQELEKVKQSILENIETVQNNGRIGKIVPLKTVRSDSGHGSNYLIVGLSPGGCATGRNRNSAPTVNPEDVEVLSLPCKFGVLIPIEAPGGGFTLISTHSISPNSTKIIEPKSSGTNKKTTITCVKGKQAIKVNEVNPKCPSGYKKK